MDHGAERGGGLEIDVERVGGHEPARRVAGEVAPAAVAAEPVDDDRVLAGPCQTRLQVRADETGAAGDQDHGGTL